MKILNSIITLHPQSESTQALVTALKENNVIVNSFFGADGRKNIPPLQDEESINSKEMRLRHNRDLHGSEIGCYLSHLRAIREAYNSGADRLCVFEDDVQLENGFQQVYSKVTTLSDEVEFVRFMGLKVRKRKVVQPLHEDYMLVRPERGLTGTQGYMINRRGMEKVLKAGSALYEPIDKFFDHFWEYGLRAYAVEPHVIYENDANSNITKKSHEPIKLSVVHKVKAALYKGIRSLGRHKHLNTHRSEFYPAIMPEGSVGKTKRIKRKQR